MSTRLQRPFLPHNWSRDSYLTATNSHGQPLCGNAEGWGPLSPFRWDFTPCFLDVWIAIVAVFGIVGGIGAIIYLRRQPAPPVKKDWHFYAKLVRSSIVPLINSIPLTYSLDCRCSLHRRPRPPSRFPDPVLQRCLGRGFQVLVDNSRCAICLLHIRRTIYRALAVSKSKLRPALLLAFSSHSFRREAPIIDCPEHTYRAYSILRNLLCWCRSCVGGAGTRMGGAKALERIRCAGR